MRLPTLPFPKAPELPRTGFQRSIPTKSPQPKNPMKSRLSDVLEWVCFKPHYIGDVVPHGFLADKQQLGDVLRCFILHKQFKNLAFPVGQ